MNFRNVNWWMVSTIGLTGLVLLQAWWWNKKAPDVLRIGYGR